MITYEKSQKLLKLVENYTAAAVDASWKGASPSDEAEALERDAAHTKEQLVAFVLSITANRDTIHLPQNMRQARAMIAVADLYIRGHGRPGDEPVVMPDISAADVPGKADASGAGGRWYAQEFLNWNRSQKSPPVAIGKELGVARKVMEFATSGSDGTAAAVTLPRAVVESTLEALRKAQMFKVSTALGNAISAATSGSDETQSVKVDERALREILKITYEVGPPAGSEYFTIRELCRAALAQQAASPAPAAHADDWTTVTQQRLYDLRQDVSDACQMLSDNEWAEHFAKTPEGRVLESRITELVGKATHAQQDAAPSEWLADIRNIADELEAEALNYEGDFADTVKGCAEALYQIADRIPSAALGKADAANAGGLIVEQVVESAERHEFNDHETGKRDFDRLGFAQEIYAIGRGHAMRDYINPATSAADAKDAEATDGQ